MAVIVIRAIPKRNGSGCTTAEVSNVMPLFSHPMSRHKRANGYNVEVNMDVELEEELITTKGCQMGFTDGSEGASKSLPRHRPQRQSPISVLNRISQCHNTPPSVQCLREARTPRLFPVLACPRLLFSPIRRQGRVQPRISYTCRLCQCVTFSPELD